jgi:hypothetical protein
MGDDYLKACEILKKALESELGGNDYRVREFTLAGYLDSPETINKMFGEIGSKPVVVSTLGTPLDVLLIFAFPREIEEVKEEISKIIEINNAKIEDVITSMIEEEANIISGRLSGALSSIMGREILPGLSRKVNGTELWTTYLSPLISSPNLPVFKFRIEWRKVPASTVYSIPSKGFLEECRIKAKGGSDETCENQS